jgi:hypothetical protein
VIQDERRDDFVRRLKDAPYGAMGFFETIAAHFERRNDCSVKYTHTNGGDIRLWGHWTSGRGANKKQIFATLAWQPKNRNVFARCQLTPDDLELLGFDGASKPKSEKEPQKSELHLDENYWRFRVVDFIRILEAARIKLVGV